MERQEGEDGEVFSDDGEFRPSVKQERSTGRVQRPDVDRVQSRRSGYEREGESEANHDRARQEARNIERWREESRSGDMRESRDRQSSRRRSNRSWSGDEHRPRSQGRPGGYRSSSRSSSEHSDQERTSSGQWFSGRDADESGLNRFGAVPGRGPRVASGRVTAVEPAGNSERGREGPGYERPMRHGHKSIKIQPFPEDVKPSDKYFR